MAAAQAAHHIEPPVQVDHPPAARRLVQPVHILGEEELGATPLLQASQGEMGTIGPHRAEEAPADHAPRPVTATRDVMAEESLDGDRRAAFPLAVGVTVVRDAGIRADPGAGEEEEAGISVEESLERHRIGHGMKMWAPVTPRQGGRGGRSPAAGLAVFRRVGCSALLRLISIIN